jgi:hypothetical protein
VQVDPIKPKLKPPCTKPLILKWDELLPTSAFKFNMSRYTAVGAADPNAVTTEEPHVPAPGGRVAQVDPNKNVLKPPGSVLLKVNL